MKKSTLLLAALLCSSVYAADLNLKVTTPVQDNTYFLCFYDMGCYSLHAAAQGKRFPVTAAQMNNIKNIGIANIKNRRLYFQPLSDSCRVAFTDKQTLTLTGQLITAQAAPYIQHLKCEVNSIAKSEVS